MKPPSIESNDEIFEDALCRQPLTGTKAKEAVEKFLLDAIAKADKHRRPNSQQPLRSLDALFRDLSECSGLYAWHNRKLTRILSLVRADACNIEVIQALEEPLAELFSRGFGDDFLVSVKDYKFYSGIRLEADTEDGVVDSDLILWAESNPRIYDAVRCRNPAMGSRGKNSTALEALVAIYERLGEWKQCILSMHTEDSKLQEIKGKVSHFISSGKRPNSGGNQYKMWLGASPQEFERLIDSMETLVKKVVNPLCSFKNVTSDRHERALVVLQDDIRLQANSASTQKR